MGAKKVTDEEAWRRYVKYLEAELAKIRLQEREDRAMVEEFLASIITPEN